MSQALRSAKERALQIVEQASKIRIQDARDNLGARTSGRQVRKANNQMGHTQGALERAAKPPLGWIWGDFFRPWQRMFPGEKHFNADINVRREYIPLSLIELTRLIDLGWIDPSKPIDISTLCRTQKFQINPNIRQYGFDLTEEGADSFPYAIDIEVQYATQSAIAAVEKAGGRIRTSYYDVNALEAAIDPKKWFEKGNVVPQRKAPPKTLIGYYMDAKNRGYLADESDIENNRINLANIRGYKLPDHEMVTEPLKTVDQVFHGIPAGSVISLADKKLYSPTNEIHREYYSKQVADKQYS
ncbi:unnamed protein product [Caenorhabditis angaria]|uniref:Large ribosomal subunit protein uL15m n=1 Tax=Caenorhabditis angaria TaxID=860376 RepID=A0A9P1MVN4_9PELO|nr:unnamed protein product [Caenorhabditis angaria]